MISLKYVSLLILTLQTTLVISFTRWSRSNEKEEKYLNTTVVVLSEMIKLILSIAIIANTEKTKTLQKINNLLIKQPKQTILVAVPAILYSIQNNLLFLAMSNLPGAVYQVTYQTKILTTALLSWIILKKKITNTQTTALTILFLGVILIQWKPNDDDATSHNLPSFNLILGLSAVVCASFTSGFAGVYLEKILKDASISIWLRNVQLAIYGIVIGITTMYYVDYDTIKLHGPFVGFTPLTWCVVLFHAAGGLAVAGVLKYADNILKCFANAASICLTCLISAFALGEFEINSTFVIGTIFVIAATLLYSLGMPWTRKIKK